MVVIPRKRKPTELKSGILAKMRKRRLYGERVTGRYLGDIVLVADVLYADVDIRSSHSGEPYETELLKKAPDYGICVEKSAFDLYRMGRRVFSKYKSQMTEIEREKFKFAIDTLRRETKVHPYNSAIVVDEDSSRKVKLAASDIRDVSSKVNKRIHEIREKKELEENQKRLFFTVLLMLFLSFLSFMTGSLINPNAVKVTGNFVQVGSFVYFGTLFLLIVATFFIGTYFFRKFKSK